MNCHHTKVFESTSRSGVATLDESCHPDRLVEVFGSTSSYDSSTSRDYSFDSKTWGVTEIDRLIIRLYSAY